jgi:hypothetical protein
MRSTAARPINRAYCRITSCLAGSGNPSQSRSKHSSSRNASHCCFTIDLSPMSLWRADFLTHLRRLDAPVQRCNEPQQLAQSRHTDLPLARELRARGAVGVSPAAR